MRKALSASAGERKKFQAVFSRFGKKVNYKGYPEETILLLNVTDDETRKIVADHVWFSFTSGFEKAAIAEGDVVVFEARVKKYTKGYVNKKYGVNNKTLDYKLSHPTKIHVLKPHP